MSQIESQPYFSLVVQLAHLFSIRGQIKLQKDVCMFHLFLALRSLPAYGILFITVLDLTLGRMHGIF